MRRAKASRIDASSSAAVRTSFPICAWSSGARGIRFFLHPGSGLAKKGPKWVLAAELTETTRLYARCAAKIEPEWIEEVAGDLVSKTHFDPRWDKDRGEVVAYERVTLFGLTLVPRRRVSYGAI